VAEGRRAQSSATRVEHDVDWKRGAIRASGVEASAHRSPARLQIVFGTTGDVTFSEAIRQQYLDPCRDESCRLLPEQSASLTIGVPYDNQAQVEVTRAAQRAGIEHARQRGDRAYIGRKVLWWLADCKVEKLPPSRWAATDNPRGAICLAPSKRSEHPRERNPE
jgi:hypothetical protein